jgi:hypothetical protein
LRSEIDSNAGRAVPDGLVHHQVRLADGPRDEGLEGRCRWASGWSPICWIQTDDTKAASPGVDPRFT